VDLSLILELVKVNPMGTSIRADKERVRQSKVPTFEMTDFKKNLKQSVVAETNAGE